MQIMQFKNIRYEEKRMEEIEQESTTLGPPKISLPIGSRPKILQREPIRVAFGVHFTL